MTRCISVSVILFKIICVVSVLWSALPLFGQVIITEIMFNPLGDENKNEFIELYNAGITSVSMGGWVLSDSTGVCTIKDAGFGTLLNLGQYCLILDPDYFGNSAQYDSLIPPEALVVTINHSAFCSRGLRNAQPEPIMLIAPGGDTVAVYRYTTNNADGISDEKIIPNTDDSLHNWGNSRTSNGTPGRRNSITPPDYDIRVGSMSLDPPLPLIRQNVFLSVKLFNQGIQPSNRTEVYFYCDSNNDSTLSSDELVQVQVFPSVLFGKYGDSIIVFFIWEPLFAGTATLWIVVKSPQDMVTGNNTVSLPVSILERTHQLIINEIMNRPLKGRPEWIELCNRGSSMVNLQNWYICDASHPSGVLISDKVVLVSANGYIVLTKDAGQLVSQYPFVSEAVSVSGIQMINNDQENLWLVDSAGRTSDSLFFDSSWGSQTGVSLERVSINEPSTQKNNWGLSADQQGATPGKMNSLQIIPSSAIAVSVEPNPFSPGNNSDHCTITIQVPFVRAVVTVKIFDRSGRLVRELMRGDLRGSRFTVQWNGTNNSGERMLTGMYIIFCSAVSSDNGERLEKKTTVVLVRR